MGLLESLRTLKVFADAGLARPALPSQLIGMGLAFARWGITPAGGWAVGSARYRNPAGADRRTRHPDVRRGGRHVLGHRGGFDRPGHHVGLRRRSPGAQLPVAGPVVVRAGQSRRGRRPPQHRVRRPAACRRGPAGEGARRHRRRRVRPGGRGPARVGPEDRGLAGRRRRPGSCRMWSGHSRMWPATVGSWPPGGSAAAGRFS